MKGKNHKKVRKAREFSFTSPSRTIFPVPWNGNKGGGENIHEWKLLFLDNSIGKNDILWLKKQLKWSNFFMIQGEGRLSSPFWFFQLPGSLGSYTSTPPGFKNPQIPPPSGPPLVTWLGFPDLCKLFKHIFCSKQQFLKSMSNVNNTYMIKNCCFLQQIREIFIRHCIALEGRGKFTCKIS